MNFRDPRAPAPRDPRDRDYRAMPMDNRDPRSRNFASNQDKDFRGPPRDQPLPSSAPPAPASQPPQIPGGGPRPPPSLPANLPPNLAGQDQEKASLIMQVLQLSDEQIRMLPREQRASIMQLKEQIQRSSH